MLSYKSTPANLEKPRHIVILLHGYGANGDDLLSIGEQFAPHFPDVLFISPNAPTPCEMGGPGFQWFSLAAYNPMAMKLGADAALPVLEDFISSLMDKYGVGDKDISLLGFSQGTMMSLHMGVKHPEMIRCILGFSGSLLIPQVQQNVLNEDLPICLIHGTNDQVVPVGATLMSEQVLSAANFPVESLLIPGLEHGIDVQGLSKALKFLQENIK